MKKVIYYISCLMLLFTANACVEIDNYDEPEEAIFGKVVDKNSGRPVYTEVGDGGIRLKLLELSWSDNPTPYYTTVKQDGTYQNTKIFKGHYNIEALGAFVPMYQRDGNGNVTKDERKVLDIEGTVELNFEVEPFLTVEWVGEPTTNADGTISAQVKITRGTTNADYQQELSDVWLFVNSSSTYVGENNKDDRYSRHLEGDDAKNAIGQTITVTTPKLPTDRAYYLRAGARINKEIDGRKRYNYNEPKTVKF